MEEAFHSGKQNNKNGRNECCKFNNTISLTERQAPIRGILNSKNAIENVTGNRMK